MNEDDLSAARFETDFDLVTAVSKKDISELIRKEAAYGGSWQRRGGVGAFMMLARKWDRIEVICQTKANWDILRASVEDTDEILDDIQDLRRYLLLVEQWVLQFHAMKHEASKRGIGLQIGSLPGLENGSIIDASAGYTGQD